MSVHYADSVRNTGPSNSAPPGWSVKQWHQDATADAGTNYTRPGKLHIVQCQWCEEAFAAPTVSEALQMFDRHDESMYELEEDN